MRIPTANDGYAFLGYVQHTLSQAVPADAKRHKDDPSLLASFRPMGSLKNQIQQATSAKALPHSISFDPSSILDLLSLVHQPTNFFGELADCFKTINSDIQNLILSPTPEHARALIEGFFGADVAAFRDIWATIQPFAKNQLAIALSFVSTLKNLFTPNLPKTILDAYTEYFFSENGYQTVDSSLVVPPVQWSMAETDLASLKALVSEKAGVHYVRDLTNLTVDAARDVQYNLRERFKKVSPGLGLTTEQAQVATRWFKGFGAMAEGAVTSAVEEVVLGVGQFQLNPIIAAAAGSYAGTLARKATQHVFLLELGF